MFERYFYERIKFCPLEYTIMNFDQQIQTHKTLINQWKNQNTCCPFIGIHSSSKPIGKQWPAFCPFNFLTALLYSYISYGHVITHLSLKRAFVIMMAKTLTSKTIWWFFCGKHCSIFLDIPHVVHCYILWDKLHQSLEDCLVNGVLYVWAWGLISIPSSPTTQLGALHLQSQHYEIKQEAL